MSFFTVNTNTVRKSSIAFFIIMIVSWTLMLTFTPFAAGATQPGSGAAIPGSILAIIYASAFISPFVTAVYSWFWVFNWQTVNSRITGLMSAIIASALSAVVIIWAMS